MRLEEFVKRFAEEFDETPVEQFQSSTDFKSLEEWGSLTALSIIAMVDERVTGTDIRNSKTIEDLYNLVISK